MGKVFDLISRLAMVMALSSLVYGAFQEPLIPYMQGIMGGVMDVYRLMRDYIFSGLGWTFSGLINFVGQWLNWLPPAPWFTLNDLMKDAATVYFMIGSSWARTIITMWEIEQNMAIGGKPILTLVFKFLRIIFWPIEYIVHLGTNVGVFTRQNRKHALTVREKLVSILRFIIYEFAIIMAGCTMFYVLVYAENRLGF